MTPFQTMRLLTHNFLSSGFLKNAPTGYPLKLNATKIETKEADFDEKFIKNMIPKINYECLKSTASGIDSNAHLPDALPEDWESNEAFLKEVHRVLMCVEIVEGELQCPDTGKIFPIRDGIPNMLVQEEECSK
ncbi:hypothetical protein WR25_01056 [Diploscapter pachys]|uniref:Multifunctional methyltransferase subunit TRM112-like protein n=1 Tax=Diploscapter pachys TaxID=2018661 RepID=A0A2A2JTD4_9BILA|nr:hypothetical protein WR25_01056 [Diploscapter pachys]